MRRFFETHKQTKQNKQTNKQTKNKKTKKQKNKRKKEREREKKEVFFGYICVLNEEIIFVETVVVPFVLCSSCIGEYVHFLNSFPH